MMIYYHGSSLDAWSRLEIYFLPILLEDVALDVIKLCFLTKINVIHGAQRNFDCKKCDATMQCNNVPSCNIGSVNHVKTLWETTHCLGLYVPLGITPIGKMHETKRPILSMVLLI